MAIKYMNEFILFLLLGILLYYYLGEKIREGQTSGEPCSDDGLAYLSSSASFGSAGACIAQSSEVLKKITDNCKSKSECIGFGQQSNGCWHDLKWDPNVKGSNKKTKSMYPKFFKIIRPELCKSGGACKSRKEFISKTSGRCWCRTADGKNIDGRYSSSDSRRLAQGGWATSHQGCTHGQARCLYQLL